MLLKVKIVHTVIYSNIYRLMKVPRLCRYRSKIPPQRNSVLHLNLERICLKNNWSLYGFGIVSNYLAEIVIMEECKSEQPPKSMDYRVDHSDKIPLLLLKDEQNEAEKQQTKCFSENLKSGEELLTNKDNGSCALQSELSLQADIALEVSNMELHSSSVRSSGTCGSVQSSVGSGHSSLQSLQQMTKTIEKGCTVLTSELLDKVVSFVRENKDHVDLVSSDIAIDPQNTFAIDKKVITSKGNNASQKDRKKKNRVKKRSRNETKWETEQDSKNEERKNPKKQRVRPNYFIAVQVTNPLIHKKLRMVQDHVKHQKPILKEAFVPLSTLHITLMVLTLNEEDLDTAKLALENCGKLLSHLKPVVLCFRGLGHFRNSVVFASVEESSAKECLTSIADTVRQCFIDVGLQDADEERGFKPHLTIMKLSKSPKLWKKGIKKIDPGLYEELSKENFGLQTVCGLQLCSMTKRKDNMGYYHTDHSVSFVPEDYQEPSACSEVSFSDSNPSQLSATGRQLVEDAILSALQLLKQEKLSHSRTQKYIHILSQNMARNIIKDVLKQFDMSDRNLPQFSDSVSSREPQAVIVQLEKDLAWSFQKAEKPNIDELLIRLKSVQNKEEN